MNPHSPSHPIPLDHPNNIVQGAQITLVLHYKMFSTILLLLPLKHQRLPQHHILERPNNIVFP